MPNLFFIQHLQEEGLTQMLKLGQENTSKINCGPYLIKIMLYNFLEDPIPYLIKPKREKISQKALRILVGQDKTNQAIQQISLRPNWNEYF